MRIFILLLLSCFFISGCINKDIKNDNIEFYKIEASFQNKFIGTVKFQHISNLSFQEDGVLIYNPYTKGDYVKKGQLLAKIDDTLYQIKKNEELALLSELQIKYKRAKNYYSRMDILHKAGAVSDNDWEEAEFNAATKLKEIYLQKEKINYINKQLQYTKLFSPYNGYILDKTGEVGEFVTASKTVISVVNSSKTQVEIMVSPDVINKFNLNDSVILKLNNITYNGKIAHISQSSNNTGGYLIKISLDKFYSELKEGMNVDVEIPKLNKESIFIPLIAIFEENKKYYVYKVENQINNITTIKKTAVDLGKIINEKQEVLDGLKINDTIILKGQNSVKNNSKIKL